MMRSSSESALVLGRRLAAEVLNPLKDVFVGKDEIIDLLGVSLVGGENLFLLGPPGTAKSAIVHELGRRLDGRTFEYLLTRFTEPNELFGPFDIRRLREGELVTNTDGMLPEAELVFLDELLNANSAILNSLLTVLNERVFRRGRETWPLPTLMVVAASNRLPEDDALGALFDRFLLRVRCDNVPSEELGPVLKAGWRLDLGLVEVTPTLGIAEVKTLGSFLPEVDLSAVRARFAELVTRLRHAGIAISDRRAVKLQRLVAASALLCGRREARASDLWVVRHIWDHEEQQEILQGIVNDALDLGDGGHRDGDEDHPRSHGPDSPDPESLARDLDHIATRLEEAEIPAHDRSYLRDRIGVLAGRCQWVQDDVQRRELLDRVDRLFADFEGGE